METAPALDGDALRRARERAGLSQNELARRVGLAAGDRVSRWERGRRGPAVPGPFTMSREPWGLTPASSSYPQRVDRIFAGSDSPLASPSTNSPQPPTAASRPSNAGKPTATQPQAPKPSPPSRQPSPPPPRPSRPPCLAEHPDRGRTIHSGAPDRANVTPMWSDNPQDTRDGTAQQLITRDIEGQGHRCSLTTLRTQ